MCCSHLVRGFNEDLQTPSRRGGSRSVGGDSVGFDFANSGIVAVMGKEEEEEEGSMA